MRSEMEQNNRKFSEMVSGEEDQVDKLMNEMEKEVKIEKERINKKLEAFEIEIMEEDQVRMRKG